MNLILAALFSLFGLGAFAAEIPQKLTPDAVRALVADPNFNDYKGLTDAIRRAPERDLKIFSYQWIVQGNKIEAFEPFMEAYKVETNPLVKGVLMSSLGAFASRTKRVENWNGIGSPHVPQLAPEQQARFVSLMREEARPGAPEIVRVSAIHRMGQLRLEGSTDFLLESLKDPSPSIRNAALSSLRFMGGPERQDFWLKQLREGSPELRAIAIDQLGGQDDPALDKPLEEVAQGSEPALAAAARMHLDLRAKRREIQAKFVHVMPPTPWMIFSSKLLNIALSSGWYAVAVLMIPCLFAAFWAFKNREIQTLAASGFSIAVPMLGLIWLIALKVKLQPRGPIVRVLEPHHMLLGTLVVSALLALPVLVGLVRRTSRAVIFDTMLLVGFGLIGAAFVVRGMTPYMWAALWFAGTLVYGSVQAAIAVSRGRAAEAAHCVAYASVIALLLGCMPFAFIGM